MTEEQYNEKVKEPKRVLEALAAWYGVSVAVMDAALLNSIKHVARMKGAPYDPKRGLRAHSEVEG